MVSGVILKRFFRVRYGIPVRAQGSSNRSFAEVYIPHIRVMKNGREDHMAPMRYEHEFPIELRREALDIIYPSSGYKVEGSDNFKTASAGNIRSVDMAMHHGEWEELFTRLGYVDQP